MTSDLFSILFGKIVEKQTEYIYLEFPCISRMLDAGQQIDDILKHPVDRLGGGRQKIFQLLGTNMYRLHLIDLTFDLQSVVEIFCCP